MIADVATALRAETRETGERRLLVLSGDRDAGVAAAEAALDAAGIDREGAAIVGDCDSLELERIPSERAGELLGTTLEAVVFDAHAALSPNALGRVVGAVDGGGLFVILAPPLDTWPARRDGFDATLAVPPFAIEDVAGNFRARFVDTLREHSGIAIVDVDGGSVERDGRTHPAPRLDEGTIDRPADTRFPAEAYAVCRTQDQVDALRACEALCDPGNALVMEADRGRGKSSVAGLAAGSLAAAGEDILVTAPEFRSTREAFARADELLDSLGQHAVGEGDPPRDLGTDAGGRMWYSRPPAAAGADPDVLFVDEAAAIPVPLLAEFLSNDRVGFATTVHGYEGAGRGFSVRFRDRLAASDLAVTDVVMAEPIRYAAGDPIETWAFRALLLDARPPVEQVIADASPETVEYAALEPDDLLADESLLREAFGLLVLAHYRTEPDDLARLLDAPNIAVRALRHDGHVVSVALLAREGGLSPERRAAMYEGERVRGNMLPDVLTSQLRDEGAGAPVGQRIMRIATHAAVRSRGLGSRLLAEIRAEFADDVDWFGVGYGATPDLIAFWAENGFSTVHLSTSRNESSGEHSALMLAPASPAGAALEARHSGWFGERIAAVLGDALSEIDPDVVRAALRATDIAPALDLDGAAWRHVAGMAYGPGLLDVDPRPFRRLAIAHLVDPIDPDLLTARQERLLVRRVLQTKGWGRVADALDFPSRGECMRAIGAAYQPLVDAYGTDAALAERDRYVDYTVGQKE